MSEMIRHCALVDECLTEHLLFQAYSLHRTAFRIITYRVEVVLELNLRAMWTQEDGILSNKEVYSVVTRDVAFRSLIRNKTLSILSLYSGES